MRNPTKKESILLTTEHFHYNYEIILFQKLSKKQYGRGKKSAKPTRK